MYEAILQQNYHNNLHHQAQFVTVIDFNVGCFILNIANSALFFITDRDYIKMRLNGESGISVPI